MITVLVHDSDSGRTKYVTVSNFSDLDGMFGQVLEAVDDTGESYVTGAVPETTSPAAIVQDQGDLLNRQPPGAPVKPRLTDEERQAFRQQLQDDSWEFMGGDFDDDEENDAPSTPPPSGPRSPPGAPMKPRLSSAESQARRAAAMSPPILRRQNARVGVPLRRAMGMCTKQLGVRGQRYGPKHACHHPVLKYGMCRYHWGKWKAAHPWQTHP